MITNDKYVEIATGLLEKTRNRRAEWKQRGRQEFVLALPEASIELEFLSPPTEQDKIVMRIVSSKGPRVGLWEVYEEDSDWELVSNLYNEVCGYAIGVERILEDISSFLKN